MFGQGPFTLGNNADKDGRILLTLYGATLGGYTAGGLAYALGSDYVAGLSFLGGLSGGAATYILTTGTETTRNDAFYLSSMGATGTWTGLRLAGALIPNDSASRDARIFAAGMLGATAGTSLGFLWMSDPPSAEAIFLRDVSTIVGSQVGHGTAAILGYDRANPNQRPANALRLAGGYSFYGVATMLDRSGASLPSPRLLTLNMAHGAWAGAWMPTLFSSSPDESLVTGSLKLGLGTGYIASLGMASFMAPEKQDAIALPLLGFTSGTAMGAGIPMAAGLSGDSVVAPMLAGGLVGHATGALLSQRYTFSEDDIILSGTLGAWTAYQSVGWGAVAANSSTISEEQGIGYGLTTLGTGMLVATVSPALVDLSPSESAMVASGGLWGVWYGAWTGRAVSADPSVSMPLTLLSGNAALLSTAAIASTDWDPSWRDVAQFDGMGLLGGALGAGIGVIASPKLETVAIGSLAGSTIGLIGSTFLSSDDGTSMASAGQLPMRQPGWLPPRPHLDLPFRANWSVAPWQAEDGSTGGWVQLSAQGL
jgi:hypothetical protein